MPSLGHTNLIICFTDWVEKKRDPVGSKTKGEIIFFKQMNIIGRAKRAPHWGVQSRFRVIYVYMYVGMSRMSN